ncbi:response regulator [Megalodesulfovibrio gigas]|uniref:Putative Response regulator receiver domain protein n=1 Tax=Megalodesulfovibrio gigas (strain ATCC 19364 / DSM 1382 / NCIMB 9332 / VKM B-1759) TaxID=1121448 RepID=T2GEC8_MEGG1|nr:response regulator [Megalodesulfovibrio gigas]AGW14955.1 putative Response regulator receiver domain protein [Megalodesulfovibrio gigas DSM 1382 = ATCC 19364]
MANILVADDDLFYRKIIAHALSAMGHEVQVVPNGEDVLKLMATNTYDLLVLDVFMDKVSGLEILQELTQLAETMGTPRIPAIIITSDDSECTERAARVAQATFFLLKPFSAELLGSVVEEAVKKGVRVL